jgi:Protein of unknown function (DUF3300)
VNSGKPDRNDIKYQELKWRTKAMKKCRVKSTNLGSRYGAAESNSRAYSKPRSNYVRFLLAVFCALLIAPGDTGTYARSVHQDAAPQGQDAPKIPNDQLDSLVAPVALYPDPLLAQVLAASTYPLELVQLQNWLGKHPDLKGQALTDAVQNEDWDPSVQAMSAFPDLVKQLVDGIKWTTDLGNAFLAQQSDVMDAVQRMRKKAMDAGNLKSTEQQTVETKVVETKTVVVVQQANPQIVYVPSYNPVVVYGPPVYPYPPIYYPPPSYYAAGVAIAFGVGLAIGSYYHGGWGYNCGWGRSNVNININNNYVRHYNNTNINRGNINTGNINRPSTLPAGGGNNWQHNPQHRGGTPYSNRATATQYGGTARGDSVATRQANARQGQARQQPASINRGGGGGNAAIRPGGGGANASTRPAGGGANNMGANRGGNGGGDRVGNRQVPNTPSATNKSAFGGASSGMSGNAARTSNQRGASSMGASGGGAARSGGRKR